MRCAACGTDNPVGAKFCLECGAPLAAACPSCGSAVVAGAKFCLECGTRLAETTAAASLASPDSTAQEAPTERRIVSVVFADLVGFTTLAEGRDSEAVRDLLSRYFDRASTVVARYGGTVEKFIGDAVMAVWGTPVAHEDDAERAVRAALDLVDAVRELGGELGQPALRARAGVLTGEAVVTIGALNQGMVAGDIVNTASRLQSVAEPGTVLVGEATRLAAQNAVVFEAIESPALKGKNLAVKAHRALRVVATVGGSIRAETLEPPFVGRETEFRLLRELFHATGRERRARLVSLMGQAGIGKSRLAWEFEKYLDGIREPIWWHAGRSPAYGEGVTFWALGEMVRKRAGLVEGDDEATGRARISASVAEHIPDADEAALAERALIALLGIGDAPPGGRDSLFAGWRLFIERMSQTSTVVLVFEDVHWADDGLLDFIEHVLEWSRSYPIFVVTLSRPELLDRRPTWGAATRSASSLALGPLTDAEMRDLLAGLVPGLPESAVGSVLERADGIPLYAVETVRMLVADGRLESDGSGRYRPTGKLADLKVPATLQALIAARLDGLDPVDRALLQDASVLGKTFTGEALAAVSGTPESELGPRLRALVARELLELDTDPSSPERGQYGFVQALIREVAYSTLARRDRRTRHLAAARFFEARGEDELAPVLASHYLDAYRAAADGPEAAALRAQARVSLRAAAERAESLGSYGNAVTYLEQAIELGASDPHDEAELLERAGVAADHGGHYEQAIGLLTRALERARESGDPARVGRTAAALGLALSDANQRDRAMELLEAVRAEFAGPGSEHARAPVEARMGQLLIRVGAGLRAVELVEQMLPTAEQMREESLLIDALLTKAAGLSHAGRPFEASVLTEGIVRVAAERGHVAQHMRAMLNLSVQSIDEDPWRAFELGVETIDKARRLGLRSVVVYSVLNTVELGLRVGEWDGASSAVTAAETLDLDASDRELLDLALATLQYHRGEASDRLDEFLARDASGSAGLGYNLSDLQSSRAQAVGAYAEAYRLMIDAARTDELNAPACYARAIRAAQWSGNAELARAAVEEFRGTGRASPLPVAQLAGAEAGVLALEGRRAEAVDRYRDAVQQLHDLRVAFDGALVGLDAARLLGITTPEGAAAAAEARAVFERLGARPWLAVLDGLGSNRTETGARRPSARTERTPA